jgi:hypothetical protein|tara:strand:- start:267 stop:611 length:345 start_codon:yes stop_codon:yes gene_type:complete
MKYLQSLIILTLCLIVLNGFGQKTNQGTNYVVVKIYEPIHKSGEIIIAYGKDKSERIAVEKLDSEHHEYNSNRLVDIFNRLNDEGFELISSSSSAHGNPASILHVNSFVFGRKD